MKINYRHEAMLIKNKLDNILEKLTEDNKILSKIDNYIYKLNLLARMQELDEFKAVNVEYRFNKYKKEYKGGKND